MAGAEEVRGNSRQVVGELTEGDLGNLSGFEKQMADVFIFKKGFQEKT